ncbi:MAG: Nif11 family protein [Tatlockia sp.]|nr:Nif11 family protein [Tatlockia sp.]
MVQSNQQLQDQLKVPGNKESFLDLVVHLGQENGYTFTSQEVEAFLNQKSQERTSELNDAALESVADGVQINTFCCFGMTDCWASVC